MSPEAPNTELTPYAEALNQIEDILEPYGFKELGSSKKRELSDPIATEDNLYNVSQTNWFKDFKPVTSYRVDMIDADGAKSFFHLEGGILLINGTEAQAEGWQFFSKVMDDIQSSPKVNSHED